MTIAEFVSGARTQELLLELDGQVPVDQFVCDAVDLAVPDSAFRFVRQLSISLGGQ